MNILQDILGLITKGKVKPPTDKDYMVVASYTDAQEILKPQPKMQANLINLGALKKYIQSSAGTTPTLQQVTDALLVDGYAETTNPIVVDGGAFLSTDFTGVASLSGGFSQGYGVDNNGFRIDNNDGVTQFSSFIRQATGPYTSSYDWELPNASGTLALTSNLDVYVPYSGATTDVDLGDKYLLGRTLRVSNSTGSFGVLQTDNLTTNRGYQLPDADGTIALTTYNVYTALLTQSGADNPDVLSNSDLTIGVTYEIKTGSSGSYDFTNVGAPNNDIGTYFVATGTTPNDWAGAFLNYNTGAPVVKVLENTIGNIWFQYSGDGLYLCKSLSLFTPNKTIIDMDAYCQDGNPECNLVYQGLGDTQFKIGTYKGGYDNSRLSNHRLEIRVYN